MARQGTGRAFSQRLCRIDSVKRLAPHLLWVMGLALLLGAAGKGSGAALPYQDPTPELLALQRGELQTAKATVYGGASLVAVAVLWSIRRHSRRASSTS